MIIRDLAAGDLSKCHLFLFYSFSLYTHLLLHAFAVFLLVCVFFLCLSFSLLLLSFSLCVTQSFSSSSTHSLSIHIFYYMPLLFFIIAQCLLSLSVFLSLPSVFLSLCFSVSPWPLSVYVFPHLVLYI